MTEARAKLVRRKLRRAMGDEAVTALERFTAQVNAEFERVKGGQGALEHQMADLSARLTRGLDEMKHYHDLDLVSVRLRLPPDGLWARLRWLVRG